MTSAILELETPSLKFHVLNGTSLENEPGSGVRPPLPDAAVQHITRLPKLTTWIAMNGPSRVSDWVRLVSI
jgi:hypothetical protein